jgi:DNA-binding GntR family transcriptional regulator
MNESLMRVPADHDPRSAAPPIAPPLSMAEHVRQVLRLDILEGRLKPGDRIIETAVAERTQVSRTPVREGLRLLESEGLILSRRSRGYYVATRLSHEDVIVLYGARLEIEPHLTAKAAVEATPVQIGKIQAALERFTAELPKADMLKLSDLDVGFHRAIYAASGSPLAGLFDLYWSHIHPSLAEVIYRTEDPSHFQLEHVAIVDALREANGELAARRMAEHIRHGQDIIRSAHYGQASDVGLATGRASRRRRTDAVTDEPPST